MKFPHTLGISLSCKNSLTPVRTPLFKPVVGIVCLVRIAIDNHPHRTTKTITQGNSIAV